jgi:uncharacterized protein YndB with AHSA1/START domain
VIADIKKTDDGYLVKWERNLNHSVEAVWAMLTDNERLEKWFDELRAGDLRQGGFMKFYVPDVMDEKLEIREYEPNAVLEFDWFGDVIRFELHPENEGCALFLLEKVQTITEQTKKDLAGWHVCLDVIIALLDGDPIKRDDEWKQWHAIYTDKLKEFE